MQIYRVGGYVRDRLLGKKAADCDYVVVGATTEQMLQLGYIQVGRFFPVFLHPKTHEEYALARTERKIGPGHKGFMVFATPEVSLNQDLQRRDLTINAIAENQNGELIDPFHGVADLKHKILRHISAAFSEDPLRILRVARFAACLNFTVAPETMELLKHMARKHEGKNISRERIIAELEKALAGAFSANFFQVLYDSANLNVFFPTLGPNILKNYTQFNNEISQAQDPQAKNCILSLYSTNFSEITLNKQQLRFLHCCKTLHTTICCWETTANYILQQIKRLNIWRYGTLFYSSLASYAQYLQQKSDLMRLAQLHLLQEIAINLRQQKISHLIKDNYTTPQIITVIDEHYLSIIKKHLTK